jgi:hypothetical protein
LTPGTFSKRTKGEKMGGHAIAFLGRRPTTG